MLTHEHKINQLAILNLIAYSIKGYSADVYSVVTTYIKLQIGMHTVSSLLNNFIKSIYC